MRRSIRKCVLRIACVASFALLTTPPLYAQAGRQQVQEGNRLYEEGSFEEAHQKYLEALAADPESGVIRFNDGNALYQRADYERAMDAYQRAIETGDPTLASSAWYNLGNALYRQQQLQESLEAYKNALRLNPGDPDAKHNLERVLEQMEEQEQDPQEGEGDQGEEDEQQRGDQQQDPQDEQEAQQDQVREQEQEPDPGQEDEPPPPQDADGQDGEPQPQPGDMTAEEAERLLDAIEEDPDEVDRQRAPFRGRRPRKPW